MKITGLHTASLRRGLGGITQQRPVRPQGAWERPTTHHPPSISLAQRTGSGQKQNKISDQKNPRLQEGRAKGNPKPCASPTPCYRPDAAAIGHVLPLREAGKEQIRDEEPTTPPWRLLEKDRGGAEQSRPGVRGAAVTLGRTPGDSCGEELPADGEGALSSWETVWLRSEFRAHGF